MNENLIEIPKNELKVGDLIAVERRYIVGWNTYVCGCFELYTIDSISPKRTKIMINNRNIAKEHLFVVNDYIRSMNARADKIYRLAEDMYKSISILNTQKKVDALREAVEKVRSLSEDELSRCTAIRNAYYTMIQELLGGENNG